MGSSLILTIGLVLIRLLVGGMLVLAGILKLKAGPHWFLQQILAYDLVKGKAAWWLARGLPWAEVLCGVFLIAGLFTPLVAVFSFALLWGFTVAVVSTFLRGKPVDCGCFGRKTDTYTHRARWTVAYRNLTLMGLLVAVFSLTPPLSVDAWLSRGLLYQLNINIPVQAWLAVTWIVSLIASVSLQRLMQAKQIADKQSVRAAS